MALRENCTIVTADRVFAFNALLRYSVFGVESKALALERFKKMLLILFNLLIINIKRYNAKTH